MFLVMRLRRWDTISTSCMGFDIPVSMENPDCIGFLEVYRSREEAERDYGKGVELMQIQEKEFLEVQAKL